MKKDDLEKRVSERKRISPSPRVIRMSKKHLEKYAVVSDDNKIIAYGEDPSKIIKEARKKGFEVIMETCKGDFPNAGLMYIRDPRKTYIYNAA